MSTFGDRIVEMRTELGMQQGELRDTAGIRGSFSEMERGKRNPTYQNLISICGFAVDRGYRLEWLLLGNQPKKIESEIKEDCKELIEIFNSLDRKGKTAVLHEADIQLERVKTAGDSSITKEQA